MNTILIFFAIKYQGNWDKIYQALETKEKVSLEEIKKIQLKIKKENWKIITIIDLEYPKKLKETYKPPFVLWLQGNLSLLNKKTICLTGNGFNPLVYRWLDEFVPQLALKATFVTGSYKGVDQQILSKAKNHGFIFVLANGINKPWINRSFKEKDLMITEYPPGTEVTKENLRNRNRLISALSQKLVIISSYINGPINNLVSNFLNLGKEIFCFSGDGSQTDGNSELIKQGSNLITQIEDLEL